MNGKKSKSLRAAAASKTINLPKVAYEETNVHQKQYGFHGTAASGAEIPAFATVSTIVMTACKKRAEKNLKKIFGKGVKFSFSDLRAV